MSRRATAPSVRWRVMGFVLDVVVVLAFVSVGRRTHDEGDSALGILGSAWPFLAALAIGWLISLALTQRFPTLAPLRFWGAVVVWACTVTLGMILRRLAGDGTASAFIIVALITLAVGMLGWRLVGQQLVRRWRNKQAPEARIRA